MRRVLLAAVIATSGIASAAPKTPKAKAAFTAGVKAYQKGTYAIASKYLEKSFSLERDVETLFAWAQTERQLEHCDKASELYDKILTFDLPAENKAAVQAKLEECKTILDAAKPKPEPKPEPKPVPMPVAPLVDQARVEEPPPPPSERAWWKNPVGLTSVGLGVIATSIGTYYLVQGSSAHTQMEVFDGKDRTQYLAFKAEAQTDGKRGITATAIGGGLIVVGVIWFATHRSHRDEAPAVTGWIAPGSSGLALTGRF